MFKKIIKLAFAVLVLSAFSNTFGQQLLTPSDAFSHQKTAYITKMDGTEIKGVLSNVSRKKGLIEEIKITDLDGVKLKLKAVDIKYMYLPPSGLDKLGKAMDALTDYQKWNDEKMNNDLLNQGYVYFEQSEVMIKKAKLILLMQLLNPTFSKSVKIYQDPYAAETSSIGVGGITVAGGDEKSYYFKKGNEPAYKLEKKNYKKEFKLIWSDCNKLTEKYGAAPKWTELAKHTFEYTSECK